MGYVTQMAGLAVQNFVSAAVGIVVVIALIRGFMRNKTDRLGNFWVDLTRCVVRLLLPFSVVGAIILMATGVIDNFTTTHLIHSLAGAPADDGRRPGGLAGGHQGAGQQRRRLLQRQLRAPVREPEPVQQLVRDLPAAGDPVRAAAHVRQDGRRQPAGLPRWSSSWRCCGWPPSAASASSNGSTPARRRRPRTPRWKARRSGSASRARSLFAGSTTVTSTGAVNSLPRLASPPFGGGIALFDIDAGRGRPRRRRRRPVRHADAGGADRVRRRPDGRPDAGVHRQEDPPHRDEVGRGLHPGHAVLGAHRRRAVAGFQGHRVRRSSTPDRTASPRSSTRSPRWRTTTARRSPA